MKSKSLNELLKSLSKSEYKRLGEFIRSPYHNKNKNLISLHTCLSKVNVKDDTVLPIEDFSSLIFPGKFDKTKMRKLVSEFVKVTEKFLAVSYMENNDLLRKRLLLTDLNIRNASTLFKKRYDTLKGDTADIFNKDEEYYENLLNYEIEQMAYTIKMDTYGKENNFNSLLKALDYYFILSKLNMMHITSYYSADINKGKKFEFWLHDEISDYINTHIQTIRKEAPVIYLKYLIHMTIIKPEMESYYFELKRFVKDNHNRLGIVILEYAAGALMNYTINKHNKGNIDYKKERFSITCFLESSDRLSKSVFIKHVDFFNAILSAIAVNEIEWAEEFFNKHKSKIDKEFRNDTLKLAEAEIKFGKKKVEEAAALLNQVSYKYYYFYLRAKMMLVKIYTGSGETEPVYYVIDAVKHYLKRNVQKIPESEQEMFLKFNNYTDKIIKARSSEALKELGKKIKTEENIASKEWLLEEVERRVTK